MASSDPPNTPSCPVDHCPIPVDIAIKSSDGRTFGAHAKNLEWFTEGFPLVDSVISTVQEPVELTEDGDVLALLLTFTHNLPAPDLTGRSIDAVMGLADAADKYGVHYALVACRKAMRSLSEDSECNALRIVKYKASHNDLEDIDYIAPRTMNFSIVHVLEFFGEDHAKPFWRWVR
ncbi:hypothetical protein VNI00_010416 [Paramarasmius palmivorus]|uniref:BTB domain-containing protein n=1 Tax=Paramarasmius palmivorus TaxID=297713 RepID=A0AAW0BS46_9AGAR